MQNNWSVIGHEKIINFLQNSIKNDKLSHAYLFYGPNKVGKLKVALEFVKTLECENKDLINKYTPCNKCKSCVEIEKSSHPDALIIKAQEVKKDKKTYEKKIGIEEIQQIQHYLSLFPHSAPYKTVIIDGAEKLSREASNSFLKTLEEPSNKSILILITDSIGAILPTIISRTQIVKFLAVSNEEMLKGAKILKNTDKENLIGVNEAINFSMGKPGIFIDLLNNPSIYLEKQESIEKISELIYSDTSARYKYISNISKDGEQTKKIIGDLMLFFRDLLLLKKNCSKYLIFKNKMNLLRKCSDHYTASKLNYLLCNISEAGKMASNTSFNSKLILEVLFLKI